MKFFPFVRRSACKMIIPILLLVTLFENSVCYDNAVARPYLPNDAPTQCTTVIRFFLFLTFHIFNCKIIV